jgi:hypothetical protein
MSQLDRTRSTLALALGALALASPAAQADKPPAVPTLEGRALLASDTTSPAPFPGVVNTDPAPAPGATQPVGGFSALVPSTRKDIYWAMPDNGFGSKANSRSFLLRVYEVRPDFRTAKGGTGGVDVLRSITLRDPDRKLAFPIVTEGTPERLLTGGDFDIESVRQVHDGTLWFGEEFGPFLVHTDATGKVLEAPVPTPGVRSPSSPLLAAGQTANLPNSSGFEGMALSADGKTLHPVLEGAVAGDDARTRRVYSYDLATRSYAPGFRAYRVDEPAFSVADFVALDDERYVALERDNGQGAAARHKQAFVTSLGAPDKRLVLDELDIADPAGVSLFGARPGDIGLGDPFSMPYQTIEALLPVATDRVVIVNDTNFGSTGRNPARADDSDFIEVRVPGLKRVRPRG